MPRTPKRGPIDPDNLKAIRTAYRVDYVGEYGENPVVMEYAVTREDPAGRGIFAVAKVPNKEAWREALYPVAGINTLHPTPREAALAAIRYDQEMVDQLTKELTRKVMEATRELDRLRSAIAEHLES